MESVRVNREMIRKRKTQTDGEVLTAEQFTRIYELYFDRVYKYVYYRIQNRHETEDVCSRIFEKVILKYRSFSAEKAEFDIWLFAIARNSVTDYFRARKKGFHFSLDSIAEPIMPKSSPEEAAIRDDDHRALFQALGKLRDKERHIIELKFAAGLKHAEIAKLMGVSESNIGVVVHRSLKKLHGLLEKGRFKDE